MRDAFSHHFRPSDEQLETMWNDATFVFDANVLLNLYRWSKPTRNTFLNVLRGYRERLWLPHQVADEFLKGRLGVIAEQIRERKKIRDDIEKFLAVTSKSIGNVVRGDSAQLKASLGSLSAAAEKLIEDIDALEDPEIVGSHETEDDQVWSTVEEIFGNCTGLPYSAERMIEIYALGEGRYDQAIPPGFKDAHKKGVEKYGDLVIWFQMMDFAKVQDGPVIYITADTKEDWWEIHQGKNLGPLPALIKEMKSEADVSFYAYRAIQFIELAKEALGEDISDESLEEIRKLDQVEQFGSNSMPGWIVRSIEKLPLIENQIMRLRLFEAKTTTEIVEYLGMNRQDFIEHYHHALWQLTDDYIEAFNNDEYEAFVYDWKVKTNPVISDEGLLLWDTSIEIERFSNPAEALEYAEGGNAMIEVVYQPPTGGSTVIARVP